MRVEPYLVGILFGDGSTSKRKDGAYAVWIDQTERNKQIIQHTIPKLQQLGYKVYSYRYFAKADKVWKYRALVYSKELYQDLRAKFRDIATYIGKLSDEGAKNFIAGVMDAEGTVTDRVVIYNGNKTLLEAIQRRLELLGIKHSHIYRYSTIHGLQIYRRDSLQKLMKAIPSIKLRSKTIRNR
jgi:LAGLIDADG-like domain